MPRGGSGGRELVPAWGSLAVILFQMGPLCSQPRGLMLGPGRPLPWSRCTNPCCPPAIHTFGAGPGGCWERGWPGDA